MSWLPLLLCSSLWAAVPPGSSVPPDLERSLETVDRAFESVETGRRLLAASAYVPLKADRLEAPGPAAVYRGGAKTAIVLDSERIAGMRLFDVEIALARARARAEFDAGVPLLEREQAAEEEVLRYALERADASPEFRGRLRKATAEARAAEDAGQLEEEVSPDAALGLAELLLSFERDPDDFYWLVGRSLAQPDGAVSLGEVDALLTAYGPKLDRAVCPPPGRYCRLDGLRLSPPLVAAARLARALGGTGRLREPLGDFDGRGAAELRVAIERWLKRV